MPFARIAPLFAVLFALAAPARAESACKQDVARFCKDIPPGGGRILVCLKQHEADLSDGCKAEGARLKARVQEIAEACKGDAEKLCPNVKPGLGRVRRCLWQHRDLVSEGCKESVQQGKQQKGG